jgi:SAM-dependent methyltransferase
MNGSAMAIIESTTPDVANAVPANYRKGSTLSRHQRRRHSTVLSLLEGVTGSVLDYGCGYGDLTHAISQTHRAVGCDVDPDRVAFALREYAPLQFAVCQGDSAPYGDESFDIVVSSVVIHFVNDPVAHLREIRRVIRPGGYLLIVFKCPPVVRNWFRRLIGKGDAKSRLWVRPCIEYELLLKHSGFEVTRSTYFYDPPFEGWKNVCDCVFGAIEQALSAVRVKGAAGYHAFLARKTY